MAKDLPADLLGASLMLFAAAYAYAVWRLLRDEPGGRGFWLLSPAGLALLALDEALSVHERAARELVSAGVSAPGGLNHLDDVFVLAYGLIALTVVAVYARTLLTEPRSFQRPFALALVAIGTSIAIDVAAPIRGWAPVLEETAELAGAGMLLLAFGARYVGARGRGDVPPSPIIVPAAGRGAESERIRLERT